jgi:hypothetical protein
MTGNTTTRNRSTRPAPSSERHNVRLPKGPYRDASYGTQERIGPLDHSDRIRRGRIVLW